MLFLAYWPFYFFCSFTQSLGMRFWRVGFVDQPKSQYIINYFYAVVHNIIIENYGVRPLKKATIEVVPLGAVVSPAIKLAVALTPIAVLNW